MPRLRSRQRETIYAATLDYNYQLRNRGLRLRPADSNAKEIETGNVDPARLEQAVRTALEDDLPRDMRDIYGIKVETRILATRDGSIIVFFGVLFTLYQLVAGYKDFLESIPLIRRHAEILVRAVARRFSDDIDVTVEVLRPVPESDELPSPRRLRKLLGHLDPGMGDSLLFGYYPTVPGGFRRDGFFWFLLVATILLFALLTALVAGAVMRTYF